MQPFSRSEKVVTGVILVPWAPGEVTSSLLFSAGSIPCAAGQLGRAGSITSAVPPAPLWGGLDVPPSPGALDSPAAGAGSPPKARTLMPAKGSPAWHGAAHPGATRRGAGATRTGAALIPGLSHPWGCVGPAGTGSASLYIPSVFPVPRLRRGPVRELVWGAGAGDGCGAGERAGAECGGWRRGSGPGRVRGRCGCGAVPSRPARASRARSAALVPPPTPGAAGRRPRSARSSLCPPRAAASPLPAAAGAMPPAYVMKRAAGLGSAGSSREP